MTRGGCAIANSTRRNNSGVTLIMLIIAGCDDKKLEVTGNNPTYQYKTHGKFQYKTF